MRFLLRWSIKLSLTGLLYMAATSGAAMKLATKLLGPELPPEAQQWVDRNAQMGAFGKDATAGFGGIADVSDKQK